mmetsp:Transcript_1973/g.5804  ORF Transcript_1973/g.5804 Transcript_1973/m.5804 type:complete len:298 (+) Transcript_1973:330-1223(+)
MSAQAQRDYGYFPPGAPYPYGPMAGPPPELPTAAELSHLNHPLLTPTLASAFSIPWAEYGGADQMGGQPGGWGAHPSAGPQDNGMPPREPHPNMGYGYSPARGGQGMPDETAQGPSGPYQNGMGGMNGMPASPYGALHPGMPPPGHPGGHPSPAMEGGPGMPPAGMPYNPQMMGYDPWEAPAMSGMPPQYGMYSRQGYPPMGDYAGSSGKRMAPDAVPPSSSSKDEDQSAQALKRPRLVWTPQLHKRFEDAVNQLGIKHAVPKTIMQVRPWQCLCLGCFHLLRGKPISHLQCPLEGF